MCAPEIQGAQNENHNDDNGSDDWAGGCFLPRRQELLFEFVGLRRWRHDTIIGLRAQVPGVKEVDN